MSEATRYAVIETALCIGGNLHGGEVLMVRADDHDRDLAALRNEKSELIAADIRKNGEVRGLHRELAALREELANKDVVIEDLMESNGDMVQHLQSAEQLLADAERRNATLGDALIKIIEMNRQQAKDQYGDAEKAESWSCITVARAALGDRNAEN